jgi:hypothetical protein
MWAGLEQPAQAVGHGAAGQLSVPLRVFGLDVSQRQVADVAGTEQAGIDKRLIDCRRGRRLGLHSSRTLRLGRPTIAGNGLEDFVLLGIERKRERGLERIDRCAPLATR